MLADWGCSFQVPTVLLVLLVFAFIFWVAAKVGEHD